MKIGESESKLLCHLPTTYLGMRDRISFSIAKMDKSFSFDEKSVKFKTPKSHFSSRQLADETSSSNENYVIKPSYVKAKAV